MSSNTLNFTCIGNDAQALETLHRQLQAAIGMDCDQWAAPLQAAFDDWNEPSVLSASLRGQTLRFLMDTASSDHLEKHHCQALHAAGAEHIRVRIFFGQVGETQTLYFHGGRRASAKLFPAPTLTEGERLYELVLDQKDAALAKEIKAGASPDEVVDGKPLVVHVAEAHLEKSLQALMMAKAALTPCLPWAHEVAAAIGSYGGKKSEAWLQALIEAEGADPAALWRSAGVVATLCKYPKVLAKLLARDGVDVNAMLVSDEEPHMEMGSLLFNSRELFEDDPAVLAVLTRHGARSIVQPDMPDETRLHRTLMGSRDADTVAQLVASGVNLDSPLGRGDTLLRSLLRHPYSGGARMLTMANELLQAGASADVFLQPDGFRREVLEPLFNATGRIAWRRFAPEGSEHFEVARDGGLVVEFMRGLLARGLDADLEVTFKAMVLGFRGPDTRYPPVRYRGPLLGAIACLLCGRGSDLRPLCLPLVELLLQHGASRDATAVAVSGRWQPNYDDMYLHGEWPGNAWEFAPEGSVLERLRQRQAQAPDAVDAKLIAMLEG